MLAKNHHFQAETLEAPRPAARARPSRKIRKSSILLWTAQALLTFIFLFAGGAKLLMPIELLTAQTPLPGLLIRFIGTCEVLGAIAMILPGLLRIKPVVTPLAAVGLTIIVTGATVLTLAAGDVAGAVLPFVTLIMAVLVAVGRVRLAPQEPRLRTVVLQPASVQERY
jgi:hypothetical protein